MKIILSRKGFDTANGGIASPIFEDGTMVSLPIPDSDGDPYCDFSYSGLDYDDILKELRYKEDTWCCHADPDLDQGRRKKRIENWVAAFGQIGSSATYLKNIGVEQGDIFLFFGNFHCVKNDNGVIRIIRNTGDFYRDNDIQAIWGYLQVGEIFDTAEKQKKLSWHPHSNESRTSHDTNVIFKAAETLSFDSSKPGAGLLTFDEKRVLTSYGHNKATWKNNSVYDPEHIYGQRRNSASDPESGIYYAGVWQELGLKESEECTEWAKFIISDNCSLNEGHEKAGNVLLTAVNHNWGLQCSDDWHKTLYILRKDGELTIVIYEGESISEKRKTISVAELSYIRNHIGEYIRNVKEIRAYDGDAWEIQYGLQEFKTGYVYGSDLERITDILYAAGNADS